MAYSWLPILGATSVGFLATGLAISKIRNHALRLGFVDYPGGRKQHPKPVPPRSVGSSSQTNYWRFMVRETSGPSAVVPKNPGVGGIAAQFPFESPKYKKGGQSIYESHYTRRG